MPRKQMIWKTFSITNADDMRRLQSAWGSSKEAFGKGKVMNFGGTSEVETNIPISGLRVLLHHAGVRIPGGFDNGIVWDTMSLDERDKLENG